MKLQQHQVREMSGVTVLLLHHFIKTIPYSHSNFSSTDPAHLLFIKFVTCQYDRFLRRQTRYKIFERNIGAKCGEQCFLKNTTHLKDVLFIKLILWAISTIVLVAHGPKCIKIGQYVQAMMTKMGFLCFEQSTETLKMQMQPLTEVSQIQSHPLHPDKSAAELPSQR